MNRCQQVLLRLDTHFLFQDAQRIGGAVVGGSACHQALVGQRVTDVLRNREVVECGVQWRHITHFRCNVRATLIHRQRRGVIQQAAAVFGQFGATALADGKAGIHLRIDVGLRHRHPVDQPLIVKLSGTDRSPTAVGNAGRNHQGILRLHLDHFATISGFLPEFLVQHIEAEFNRLQYMPPPVSLGVGLGVSVLVGETVRPGGIKISPRLGIQIGPELHRLIRLDKSTVDTLGRVGGQVVGTGSRALVGVDHGAAFLQAPFAGGADRAVNAAGTGRGRRYHTGLLGVETGRHLDHHSHRHITAINRHVGQVFITRNQPLATAIDLGTKEFAVTTTGHGVHKSPIVVVDGQRPEFFRRGVERIIKGRCRCTGQAAGAKATGQKIIGDAIILSGMDLSLDESRELVERFLAAVVAGGTRQSHRTNQRVLK